MAYGLPVHGEGNWDTKVSASITALQDGTVVNDTTSGMRAALDNAYAGFDLPAALGNAHIFAGDSITAGADVIGGTGSLAESMSRSWGAYATWLSGGQIRRIRNAGIAGDTSTMLLARFDADVLAYRPKVVPILIGTNDIRGGVGFSTWTANVKAMVDKCRRARVVPVLCTLPPEDEFATYKQTVSTWNTWLRRYSAQQGLPLVDFHTVLVDPATSLYLAGMSLGDLIHPNEAGQKAMGAEYVRVVAPLLRSMPPDLPMSQTENSCLMGNVLYLSSSANIPSGWAAFGGGTIAHSLNASPPSPWRGTQYISTVTAGTSTGISLHLTTGFSVGDVLAFCGRFSSDGGGTSAYLRFNTGSTKDYMPLQSVATVTEGVFYIEGTVPTGTTSLDLLLIGNVGVHKWGQIGLRNLTTLGVLTP